MSDRTERLVRAIFKLRTPSPAGSPHYVSGWETALDAAADVVRQDAEGDELNPSATELDAQAYRRLRDAITATMDDPDRWDRDADEGSVLKEYVRWLADGKPARDDGWDDDAPSRTTLPDVLRGAANRIDSEDVPQKAQDTADFIDGVRWATGQLRTIAAEADASPGDIGWLPDWLTELAREHAASLLRDDIGNAADRIAAALAAAGARQDEPVVTVHTAPDLSPAAEEALGALIDVAKQQATEADADGLRCVCGDPVQLMDEADLTGWIHSPGSDTRCLEARPRCPHCQMPHAMTPSMKLTCESIRASIRDRDAAGARQDGAES